MRLLIYTIFFTLFFPIICSSEVNSQESKPNVDLHAKLSVTGEVKKPGRIKYQKDLTVLQAIALAGGSTANADMTHVTLLRNGKKWRYDLTNPAHQRLKLYAGDGVIVAAKPK
ncbi:hypothetical protein NT6N_23500 [Oceaniferula spumae]|uniref:SLBB domain-containing protein n=1 Tax=Oceaniferula spumae TaxID=2979115 RepID=A0AAT9FMY2_9BACT